MPRLDAAAEREEEDADAVRLEDRDVVQDDRVAEAEQLPDAVRELLRALGVERERERERDRRARERAAERLEAAVVEDAALDRLDRLLGGQRRDERVRARGADDPARGERGEEGVLGRAKELLHAGQERAAGLVGGGRRAPDRGAQQIVDRRAERLADAAQRPQRGRPAPALDGAHLRGGEAGEGGKLDLLQAAPLAQRADGLADAAGLLLLDALLGEPLGDRGGRTFQAGLLLACALHRKPPGTKRMVARVGVGPTTQGFSVPCSTTELPRHVGTPDAGSSQAISASVFRFTNGRVCERMRALSGNQARRIRS